MSGLTPSPTPTPATRTVVLDYLLGCFLLLTTFGASVLKPNLVTRLSMAHELSKKIG